MIFLFLTIVHVFADASVAAEVIPGVATVLGLAALIWKLVTDHTASSDLSDRYERHIERLEKRIVELEEILDGATIHKNEF